MRRKILTILFCCASFFIYEAVISLQKILNLHSSFNVSSQDLATSKSLDLSYLDRIGHQKYPVSSDVVSSPVIMVVPYSHHENAQYLTAATYKNLKKDDIDRVILIVESKNKLFHGVALPTQVIMNNLFGDFKIHATSLQQLSHHALFHYYDAPYYFGSIFHHQMQYLRYYLHDEITIIPLMIGHITHDNAADIARKIAQIADDRTLIVLSCNIHTSHQLMNQGSYYQDGQNAIYDRDAPTIQAIQGIPAGSHDIGIDILDGKNGYILLLKILEQQQFKNIQSYFVGYDISDKNCMKSYAAFIYQRREQQGYANYIGSYEQQQLISIAYDSLYEFFEPGALKKPCMMSYEMTQPHGAFVSLYAMSDHGILLRGCMGFVVSQEPLSQLVADMAQNAATIDHRFYSLKHQELKSTMISISLISNLQQVIHVARIKESDGLLFEYGNKSAIALPSTYLDENWNYQNALTDLCFQARVTVSAWHESTAKIFTFHSIAFQ